MLPLLAAVTAISPSSSVMGWRIVLVAILGLLLGALASGAWNLMVK